MAISLQLDKMTMAEKQEALELLWQDLYAHEEEMPLPEWQVQMLREREEAVARGENPTMSLDEARRRLMEEFGWK